MSRVYNVLTGATRPSGSATLEVPDEAAWSNSEETPYVEIGGPTGPVYSSSSSIAPSPVTAPRPTSEPRIEPKPEPARSFPRLVAPPTPAYLSVHFHDVGLRKAAMVAGDGPDVSLVAFHLPDHAVSTEYRTLRDEVRKQLPEVTSRLLLFAAALPEAGTTTVLLNLAITLALEGKARVLVVDGNVSRPGIGAKLALKPSPGLCEVLAHQIPLTWAIQSSPINGLQALTAGHLGEETCTSVGRDLPRLLGQLRQWFDWILVDAGTWGGMPERDAACPSADAVYLVTRENDVERPEFTAVRGWVKELGGVLRGYVSTRA